MKMQEWNWTGYNQYKMQGYHWPIEEQPVAILAIVHGMGEHSFRYDHCAKLMAKHQIATIAIDHYGHGKSPGARGHVNSYDDLLNSIDRLIEEATAIYPNVPVILWGHSMGGNLVLNHILRRKRAIKGAIATAPWLTLTQSPPAVKLAVGKLMRKIYPRFTEDSKLDANSISRDKNEVDKYKNDPLVHGKISTAFFFGCHEAAEWALKNAGQLKMPLYLLHGNADKLTACAGTKEFAAKAPTELVEFKEWDGFYHELHNEPEKEVVLLSMVAWIKKLV